jgi:soluble lytic murein transglycosylase
MRSSQWDQAYQALSKLPNEQRSDAVRLALGVAALHSGRHAEAVTLLAKLEEKLPLVRDEIRGWYARAAAVAGPHDEAAAILLASPRVADVLEAARAYQRANTLGPARAAIDRAVRLAERTKKSELEAHRLRAEIAGQAGDKATAVQDLRYVVREHPELAKDALAELDKLGSAVSLDHRLTVLERSANQDNIEDALRAFDDLKKKHPASAALIAMARGKALHNARDYARAVTELDRVAALRPEAAAEAKYYAARAAARAGQEISAVDRFGMLAKVRGPWAERSALRHAELLLQLGRHRDAANAFAKYLSAFKKEADESAHYGRALALLGAGEPKRARELFQTMKKRATSWVNAGILQQLEGVAAEKAGDREAATALWLDIIADQPLTWASLTAQVRLRSIGHPAPAFERAPMAGGSLSVVLPEAPAVLGSIGLDAAAELRLMTMEDEAAQRYPGRESEALCEMYGRLAPAHRRQQIGQRAASFKLLMRMPSDSDRWAWRCVYPDAYGTLIQKAEGTSGVPHRLVHAIIRQESVFEPNALSPVGARGLMQLMPYTAKRAADEAGISFVPEDVTRPDVNIRLGTFYLGKLLRTFDGSLPLAVAAYNAGPHAVRSWLSTGGDRDVDLWVARIPYRETRHYVFAVLTNYARYQWLHGGVVTPLELELPKTAKLGDRDY